MFSKIIKISIPIILISIILYIGYNSYKQVTKNTENPLNFIPNNAALILQFNDANKLYTNLNSNDIWEKLCNVSIVDSVNNQIQKISSFFNHNAITFKSNTIFISFHKVGANNSSLLFSSNFEGKAITSITQINKLIGNTLKEWKYNNQSIFEVQHQENILYVSFKGDIVFFSENKMLVEDAIRASLAKEKLLFDPSFSSAYKTINKSAEINLFFNYNSLFEYTNIFTTKSIMISNFSGWTATDLSVKNKIISANGFSAFNKSTTNYTDILKNQSAERMDIADIIPENTSFLLSIGFDNAKQLYDEKNKILEKQNEFWNWDKHRKLIKDSTNLNYNDFINEIHEEAGIFNTSANQNTQQQYTFFKNHNSISANSLIQGLITDRKIYDQYSINTISDDNVTAQFFGEIFNSNTPYFISIENYFIFGSTIASLEYLIDNYKTSNTLANSQHFKNYNSNLSSKSNLFFYLNAGKTAVSLKEKIQNNYVSNLIFNIDSVEKFTAFSLQMTSKKDLLLNNINLFYDNDFKESIKEEWFIQLDTSISMHPQFIYNHFTKENMIVVQNNNNKVFAINSKGEELWKIQLNSKILGNISSIDFYKNSKYQCLFNTNSQLFLIDRNGNNVDGFPKTLPSNTKIGHSLFDYNNIRKYRIIIVGDDNKIYNLDKNGNIVKGWKYENNNNIINKHLQNFRVGNKDYILAERNSSNTQLLAINGSERVRFDQGIQFNGNHISLDREGTLYAITSDGKLWRGTLDGNSSKLSLINLAENSLFSIFNEGVNKKFIYTNNNMIFILNSNFETINSLEIKNNITSLVTNNLGLMFTTKNELYLWNTDGIAEGFPIASDGYFNIADIDNNGKMNMINSKNGFIYNYELAN